MPTTTQNEIAVMKLLTVLALLLAAWLPPAAAQNAPPHTTPAAKPAFVEVMPDRALLAKIRQGGYVLYLRHGYTDNSRADQFPDVDLNDCNTQRLLNDQGRAQMREIGKALRQAKLPLGEILVSPMCRTRESAQLAIGERFTTNEALMYSANMTSAEKRPRLEALARLLAAPVPAGSNRLLIAHAPNLADLIGFFVKPEGTLVVFAPDGPEGFRYLASIPPGRWNELLRP